LPIAGELAGQHIKKARPMIVEKLKEKGLLVKVDENYIHRIATNSRGGGMIEPQIKEQWFVAVNKEFTMGHSEIEGIKEGDSVTLKKLMRHVVESGQIKVTPSHFVKIYYHWIDNLRDWCISRQIWFGHQVPVWYKDKEVYCDVEPPKGDGWTQDPDTLDTWFSSGLWTFSTMGWPNETEDIKNFHPTDVLETGYDILFFWVARMILMTTYLRGQIPFRDVLLHGLVRDAQKQKMSKSKGNIIDPLDLSAQYGTDALRIALIFSTAAGNDIPMSEDKIRGMKFFSNKLWNMARFIEMKGEGFEAKVITDMTELKKLAEHDNDRDMIARLGMLREVVTEHIEKFRLHDAAQTLYQYAWHEFADDYIEDVKNRVDEKSITVLRSLFVVQLKLLHPFMPFITEEIYQKMPGHGESLMIESWPQTG
jgi:valyl-tRNA synthetase